ncbi:MAG: hypothetical protein O8C61_05760 [Candidatus Methanoperedens sp.]|nr:hypothetical protein [Candidatus Methanoperedens sp.]
MDKTRYYVIGIFIIVLLSVVCIYQMNREVNGKIETNLNIGYEKVAENYTDRGNQTSIKIRGILFTGMEQEEPIEINSGANWSVNVVFDSNITDKDAEQIISKYDIPKPHFIQRGAPYPRYYVIAPKGDYEDIKNRLDKEEYVQLSKKIKITDDNVAAVIWVISDRVLPGIRSSGISLKETMVMQLIYGPETPQTESRNIMQQLDSDEKIINTNVGYLFGEERT